MISAILRGAAWNALAETIATLEAKSPCDGSAGVSMTNAGIGSAANAPSATARPSAAIIISLIWVLISFMGLVMISIHPLLKLILRNEFHYYCVGLRSAADYQLGDIFHSSALLVKRHKNAPRGKFHWDFAVGRVVIHGVRISFTQENREGILAAYVNFAVRRDFDNSESRLIVGVFQSVNAAFAGILARVVGIYDVIVILGVYLCGYF
jgi:hypothetical protein